MPRHVISWCGDANETITLIGQHSWWVWLWVWLYMVYPFSRQTITVGVEVILPDVHDTTPFVGAFIAARISAGGCSTSSATGVFFWIDTSGKWLVTEDLGTIFSMFMMSLYSIVF